MQFVFEDNHRISDYQYHTWAVLFWLGAVVVIAVLASVLPARNAVRISVRESLSYE